jgi:hypothetical protein
VHRVSKVIRPSVNKGQSRAILWCALRVGEYLDGGFGARPSTEPRPGLRDLAAGRPEQAKRTRLDGLTHHGSNSHQFTLDQAVVWSKHYTMNPIEKAARSLCRLQGESEEDPATGSPRWTAYLPQVRALLDALHEPTLQMKEAGSEIIRHVGAEESDLGHQSDAANVWRFMVDTLQQEARRLKQNSKSG